MDARVQGYPYPLVTWSRNGLHLQNTSNVSLETRLKIRNVILRESGRYTCHAENPLRGDNFTVDVYVQGIDFIHGLASFVRVDVAFQERETQTNFAVFGLLIFSIVLRPASGY